LPKLELLEDEIGRKLAEAEKSGELRAADGYGKPTKQDSGWEQTPDEFRMPFKILKNAGVVPPEVELFNERARKRSELEAAATEAERRERQKALSDIEQRLSLRLEALRTNGSL
jgi:Domain of unknown function (DUF1992)